MSTDLVTQGIAAFKAGDSIKARQLFIAAIRQDASNEQAWLALYDAVETDEQRERCLKEVLRINPSNQIAREKLEPPRSQQVPRFVQQETLSNPQDLVLTESKKSPPATEKGRKPMNNQRSSSGSVFQTFLLLFIAVILLVQLAISGYSFYRQETIRKQSAEKQGSIRKQLVDYTTQADALSTSLMSDYNQNVYHNTNVDSAIKQQVVGNDYIVLYLQLIVEQNNQLIQALADLH